MNLPRLSSVSLALVLALASLLGGVPDHAAAQSLAHASAPASPEKVQAGVEEPGDTVAAAAAEMHAVAARDLSRGEVLTDVDIRYVPLSEGESPRGEAPASLIGWRTRRVISAGEPLRKPGVSPPDLVRAGEEVQALYAGRSVVLRVTGTAAGSGAMGERVLVRVDARRRLEGVVIGPALVQLDSNESR